MADFPFVNDASQATRREVLQNDRLIRNTYLSHTESFIDDDRGGRYSAEGKPSTVVGSGPVSYPQLPPTSPANQAAMVPDEPLIDGTGEGLRLGYRVDDMGMGSAAPDSQSGQDAADVAAAMATVTRPIVAAAKPKGFSSLLKNLNSSAFVLRFS